MRLVQLVVVVVLVLLDHASCFSSIRSTGRGVAAVRPRMLPKLASPKSRLSALLPSISDGFTIATFLPQPFWLLMIGLPNWKGTKQVMQPWWPLVAFSLVHLYIVGTSIMQPDGTAPMAEFAGVFDPSGNPQGAMMGMMQYPNFVSEEWSHVLTWDIFVGRFIWLDGLRRGIFTPHSVLLTNLIGPPGLLLHFLTCIVTGKGLPPTTDEGTGTVALNGVDPGRCI